MLSDTRDAKRPFQPSITNFFARDDRHLIDRAADYPSRSLSPKIPSHIQASLLNVGMRVRKSVPEGYRTKSIDRMPEPSWQPRQPSAEQSFDFGDGGSGGNKELTPFCGIMKVGGFAQQSTDGIYDTPRNTRSEFDFPDSSQGSNNSVLSSDSMPATDPMRRNKRRFEDDYDDDDGGDGFIPLAVFEDENRQRSPRYPVSHTAMPDLGSLKPLARPRTRRKHHLCIGRKDSDFENQENAYGTGMSAMVDFEEADFLQPTAYSDQEVEMGGV